MNKMKSILIIGAGSLGFLFGFKLALAGIKVKAIVSARVLKEINNKPIIYKNFQEKSVQVNNLQIVQPEDLEKEDLIDFCIIASKAFNLDAICQQYYDILSQFTGFILLQNGIGNRRISFEIISLIKK